MLAVGRPVGSLAVAFVPTFDDQCLQFGKGEPGTPDHRDSILSEKERAANDTMLICCSGCKSEKLVLDI